MKKTIATILLIACLSTILSACGPTQKVQKPADHNDNGPLTEAELTNPNIKG